jgi:hypothetical protein
MGSAQQSLKVAIDARAANAELPRNRRCTQALLVQPADLVSEVVRSVVGGDETPWSVVWGQEPNGGVWHDRACLITTSNDCGELAGASRCGRR